MSAEPYRTLAARAHAEVAIKGSRFIGFAAPVESLADAQAFVAGVREAHADATHNVPAFRVRGEPVVERWSDDGEPSGSSGKPVLNVLQQQDLLDVAVVVTRYYGGTKLGVGGLVRAYSAAAKAAVEAAGVVERVPTVQVRVRAAYDDLGTLQNILESEGVPYEVAYGHAVDFTARVPAGDANGFRDRVRSATRGRAQVE